MSRHGAHPIHHTKHRSLAVVPILLLIVGCSTTSGAPLAAADLPVVTGTAQPGDTRYSMTIGKTTREFVLHVPPGHDASRPSALVLAFHGRSLNAEEIARISDFSAQADASGFLVAYPNAVGNPPTWNGGNCCGQATMDGEADLSFVRAVVSMVSAVAAVDEKRIYATGFSNGARFAYRLACELADEIAAIGPVSATQFMADQERCRPTRPVPVIHFHGTADPYNPYAGGMSNVGFEWVSVRDAMAFWAQKAGCPAEPTSTQSGSIVHDVYAPCQQGAAVELYTVSEGIHGWPGGEALRPEIGEPTTEISASALMWEFFQAHPLP